jgi:16S rRNA (uracil1498-N3)-methyltransferase
MARLNSFHLPATAWPDGVGGTVRLTGTEARHMLTVLRTVPDQTVRLFDGDGRSGLFVVRETDRNSALLEAVSLESHQAPGTGLTLAIGWSKSKRRDYFFEKLVELGGLGAVFWSAVRSQGQMPDDAKESWRDKCIQAAKQCGTAHVPAIAALPGGVGGLLDFARDFDAWYLAWESDTVAAPLVPAQLATGRTLLVIGPEGGLDDSEAERLIQGGFIPVTLGRNILRWETAATYCLSLGWFARQGVQ